MFRDTAGRDNFVLFGEGWKTAGRDSLQKHLGFVGRQQGETAGRDSWERLLGDSWEGQLGQLEDNWKGQLGEIARRYLG